MESESTDQFSLEGWEDDELDNPRVNSDESTPLSMSGWLG